MSNTPRTVQRPVLNSVRYQTAVPVQQTIVEGGSAISVNTDVETYSAFNLLLVPIAETKFFTGVNKDESAMVNMNANVVRIVDGPSAGTVYVFCHQLFQVARGKTYTDSILNKVQFLRQPSVEGIVGPNIVQMLKITADQPVSVA